MTAGLAGPLGAAAAQPAPAISPEYFNRVIHPLTVEYCFRCHSAAKHKGDVNLERISSLGAAIRDPGLWQRVVDELEDEEMPPDEAPRHPTDAERETLQGWAAAVIDAVALQRAGDPGPVVLRRLSNAEYTYTIRDLTGVESLDPLKEFPEDGAAGEGFTNTGQALVMSPILLGKYLDAAKGIASHAMLLPDGIRFSDKTSRFDWSLELEKRIRDFYRRFAELPPENAKVNEHTGQETYVSGPSENGRLPLERYVEAVLEERAALESGAKSPAEVARSRGLSRKYLGLLWQTLTGKERSPLLDRIRADWRAARPGAADAVLADIRPWQESMWKFGNVGDLDPEGHAKRWMNPVPLLVGEEELRLKIPPAPPGDEVSVFASVGDAGDGKAGDLVEWREARLIRPGRPTIRLREVRDFVRQLTSKRERIFAETARYLSAAAEAMAAAGPVDVAGLADRRGLDPATLQVWLDYLGIGAQPDLKLDLFTHRMTHITAWDFIQGWGSPDAPGLVANSTTDQRVLIPGIMWPREVAVHPSPTEYAAVGWRSPIRGTVRIEGTVTHDNPYFGNGLTWSLQFRRGRIRRRLATGMAFLTAEIREFSPGVKVGPVDAVSVEPGDLISLLVGPRFGSSLSAHTGLKLTLVRTDGKAEDWSLTRDVAADVLSGNPHRDSAGRAGVWNFYREPVGRTEGLPVVPAGSVISRWLQARSPGEREHWAVRAQALLTSAPPGIPGADAALYHYLRSLGSPFFAMDRPMAGAETAGRSRSKESSESWGVDPGRFGRIPGGGAADPFSLCIEAPSTVEIRLPSDVFRGAELVATARILRPEKGAAGTAQAFLSLRPPDSLSALAPGRPILAREGEPAWERFRQSLEEFARIFPAALCYSKIVTSDEAGTLTVFHREDGPFCELMLNRAQRARLDRLWDQLHFVNQDAMTLADNYDAAREAGKKPKVEFPEWPRNWTAQFNTDPPPDYDRICRTVDAEAAAFRRRQIESQPRQLQAVLDFAGRAYRRPLTEEEKADLRSGYAQLRHLGLAHEDAVRMVLARILISSPFLYRMEAPGPGIKPLPVSDTELASRLSYFLWSSEPDGELRRLAAAGRLHDPKVLRAETQRLVHDPRVRHLALEFGCEWLRLHDFDETTEKSARAFPDFAALRGAMYEETIRFLTDLFQNDRPVLNILKCDYTFLNGALASHYGIPGVKGDEWRRVDGIGKYSRGGILAEAAVLSKEAEAARTSPILRGSWLVEVILGTHLPKPPPNVPQLPQDEATENLTVREATERHVSDPRCSGCHSRFNAYGYTLEEFDAVGRRRDRDLAGRPVDTRATLNDGTRLVGLEGLRDYLLTRRRDDFLRQFCRKLLGYALGRSVILSDQPLLKEMEASLAADHYRVGAAIERIVLSPQFCEIRGRDYVSGD